MYLYFKVILHGNGRGHIMLKALGVCFCQQEMRSDCGGSHAPKAERPAVDAEFPPGAACHSGFPKEANAFFQVILPGTFKFEGKRSRSVSYLGKEPIPNGTQRTEEAAKRMVLSWSWQWWNSLTTDERSAVGSTSSKKRCV